MSDHELFDDDFMNDMLLNPDLYGMEDGLKGQEEDDDTDEDGEGEENDEEENDSI